jgi:uncharacterized membrane protein
MQTWVIPLIYVAIAVCGGLFFPRFEYQYLGNYSEFVSQLYFTKLAVSSAQSLLGAIASGMMALTAIVFTVAYITAQFNSIAYSPRVALMFVRDPVLFHSFGLFIATFIFSLFTLAWVDRENSQLVPLVSMLVVGVFLIASMLAFARLLRGVTDLQITNTLQSIGDRGRVVLRETFDRLEAANGSNAQPSDLDGELRARPVTQVLRHTGAPRSIAKFDVRTLVQMARDADALIELDCAVGDTIVYDTQLLQVRGASRPIPEQALLRAIDLSIERTFVQDPKYPIRLLVDIAIKALSPSINDPTTAVQAIDQLEDILRRLGRRALDDVQAKDRDGIVRLTYPTPNWEDFLRLSFDEIRHYGANSVQVTRRLRSALLGIAESISDPERVRAVERCVQQLNAVISRLPLDEEDRIVASQQDRQGLGVSRRGR